MARTHGARCPRSAPPAGRLRAMIPAPEPTTRGGRADSPGPVAGIFPMVAALEALQRWQAERTPTRLRELEAALEGTIRVAGVDGAVLAICAPPLPTLEVAVGTLR